VQASDGKTSKEMTRLREVRRKRTKAALLIVVFLVVPVLILVVAPFALLKYDEADVISVSCSVATADTGTSSNRSLRGIGSSGPQVEIATNECGTLILMNGITRSNASAVAQQLTDATTTSFEVGAGSHRLTSLLDGLGMSSEAHAFAATP